MDEARAALLAFVVSSPDKAERLRKLLDALIAAVRAEGRAEAAQVPFAGWTIPDGYRPLTISRCRWSTCGETVCWAETRRGKMAPLNRDGVSHFATCPGAAQLRRLRARG